MPNIAAPRISMITYEPARERLAKMRIGMIAIFERDSYRPKAASNTTPPNNEATVVPWLQLWLAALMNPYTRATMPATDSTDPTRSNRPESRSEAWMYMKP